MVIWVKFTHSSLLIPKMLIFTLAISWVTTSNLPWFTDLTFEVPMQYCYFTASDFTSITSHIHNWVLFLLWLHLFILSGVISPLFSSSILGTYRPGEFIFQCPIFVPFHTVYAVLKARILKWFAIPFSSGPRFVRSIHHDHECGETDSWRAQTKPCAQQDPETHRDWVRTVFECLLWRCRSAVACCRGSGCSKPGYGLSSLGGGCH